MKWMAGIVLAASATLLSSAVLAQQVRTPVFASEDEIFLALREAARREDKQLAQDLAARLANYPVPSYVEYFQLKARLREASAPEIRAYLERYQGSAIADRLRNDWLLELGKMRDWLVFDAQYPQFELDDDTQLKCYALMSRAAKGEDVAAAARRLLVTPRYYGDACPDLVAALAQNGQFQADDLWAQMRLAVEQNYSSLARRLGGLIDAPEKLIDQALDKPSKLLAAGPGKGRAAQEAFVVAVGRSARGASEPAASALRAAGRRLSKAQEAQAWAQVALQAALRLEPEAMDYWRRTQGAALSLEGYQWKARSALRAGDWKLVRSTITAMPERLRDDPAWIYWLGRADKALDKPEAARELFESISGQTNFYGQLALEELGEKITIPERAQASTPDEVAAMAANPGLRDAIRFYELNLRTEGNREWNWQLRRMNERQLLAAAEFARQRNLLDRMVNTSDRTRKEVDFGQRFPAPHQDVMQASASALGLDQSWVYGLIRQESRFLMTARSHVGASGLMQLMPGTAREVARRIGLADFHQGRVNDIQTNILLGTNYLNMVLTMLDGSQALATAAYNAGPRRPRAWRASLTRPVEGAIFAETIPFPETRGYVKNVLSNATYYAALFESRPQSLKSRLGVVAPQGYEGQATAEPF